MTWIYSTYHRRHRFGKGWLYGPSGVCKTPLEFTERLGISSPRVRWRDPGLSCETASRLESYLDNVFEDGYHHPAIPEVVSLQVLTF